MSTKITRLKSVQNEHCLMGINANLCQLMIRDLKSQTTHLLDISNAEEEFEILNEAFNEELTAGDLLQFINRPMPPMVAEA